MTTRVPQERRRRRPTRSGVLLSEDLIVETALRLIGEHGPEALSVRRLGAALGCDPTALYRYFHDTDDLVLAIADRIIGDAMAGFVPGDDWVAALREMALRVRAGYLAHPRAAAMAAHRVTRRSTRSGRWTRGSACCCPRASSRPPPPACTWPSSTPCSATPPRTRRSWHSPAAARGRPAGVAGRLPGPGPGDVPGAHRGTPRAAGMADSSVRGGGGPAAGGAGGARPGAVSVHGGFVTRMSFSVRSLGRRLAGGAGR